MNLVYSASTSKISRLLCLSERAVQRYLALFCHTGHVKPQECKNGPPKLLVEVEQVILLRLIIQNPGITIYLREIQVRFHLTYGMQVSAAKHSNLWGALGKECIML